MQIQRTVERIKQTGEVFTSPKLVNELLAKFPKDEWGPQKTFCDPMCGDGNFLVRIIQQKKEHGSTVKQALETTYGVDLQPDNVMLARVRTLESALGMTGLSKSVEHKGPSQREQLVMYVLYRMMGANHVQLMHHDFTSENFDLQKFVNNAPIKEQYPLLAEFREYAMTKLGKTKQSAQTEYYVIRNSHDSRTTGKNHNLLEDFALVETVCANIVCNDAFKWDFENWCPLKTQDYIVEDLLGNN
jgi:hypothetical protein